MTCKHEEVLEEAYHYCAHPLRETFIVVFQNSCKDLENCEYLRKEREMKKDKMSERINPEDCKWYGIRKGVLGCFLHPLSDNTPSHCTNSELYPCETLKEQHEMEAK